MNQSTVGVARIRPYQPSVQDRLALRRRTVLAYGTMPWGVRSRALALAASYRSVLTHSIGSVAAH
jgi:hypothetical protein